MPVTDITVGWDIGGAHLKVIALDEQKKIVFAKQYSTPMWQGIEILSVCIDDVVDRLSKFSAGNITHVVTMTAELVDYFCDRQHGVQLIAKTVHDRLKPKTVWFYAASHGFIPIEHIQDKTSSVSSMNWHATTSYIAQNIQCGVVIDMGTTTTDLIPFVDNNVITTSVSDHDRLCNNELVYTGLVRTPVMAVTQSVNFLGQECRLMAENFATMADVYRITGMLNESYDLYDAADNCEKTFDNSVRRLMRMLGLDSNDYMQNNKNQIVELSYSLIKKQMTMIQQALNHVVKKIPKDNNVSLVLLGCGAQVLDKYIEMNNASLYKFENVFPEFKLQLNSAENCSSALSVAALYMNQDEN